jgi:hypothetical protein
VIAGVAVCPCIVYAAVTTLLGVAPLAIAIASTVAELLKENGPEYCVDPLVGAELFVV